MAFSIQVTDLAIDDIEEAVTYIARDSLRVAAKWKDGLEQIVLSLNELPYRFPLIPESSSFEREYRHIIYFSHRIVYRIDEDSQTVYIVRVYHGARRPLSIHDLDDTTL